LKNLSSSRWNQFLSEYAFRQIESLLQLHRSTALKSL